MTARAGIVLIVALAAGAGCAPKHHIENPSPFDEDDPRAATADAEGGATRAPEEKTTDEPEEAVEPGLIARDDLETVLATGPGPYMRGVSVEPVTAAGDASHLHGWRVVRWDYTWADLRVGDIILTVNDIAIIRPDDVDALWAALAAADEVVIRLERDGQPLSLDFAIQ